MMKANSEHTPTSLPNYGGQAVIEGVMMRGKQTASIAMRSPDGEIVLHTEQLNSIYQSKIMQVPFLRGLLALWDALVLGMRALTISANLQTGEDEQLEGFSLYLTMFVSLSIGIGLFFLAPAGVGQLVERYVINNAWISNLVEGLFRLVLLILYLWGIGKMEDIQRVFSYHGAEHKVINAFEDGAVLTPEAAQSYPREHPRCGTAFLLIVVVFSVLLFALLGPLPLGWRLLSRVLLLPVLAGISYEYLRWTAAHIDQPIVKAIVQPNLALQRLTTSEPSLEMLEVSIAAFNAMRQGEETV